MSATRPDEPASVSDEVLTAQEEETASDEGTASDEETASDEGTASDEETAPDEETASDEEARADEEARPAEEPSRSTRILCLGEVLVDLICERPLDDIGQADSFVPHFGGAVANVAMVAAREGASVAFAGGAGDDPWGAWLRSRLEREGVETSLFTLLPDCPTAVALVTVGADGAPRFQIYGEAIGTVVQAVGHQLDRAVRDSAALFFSSNTLVGLDEREVTMRARQVALELGRPVIFDPNFRLDRWRSRADAAASSNACVRGALLVRCNQAEAAVMTGEDDPERAARALVKAGARLVVVTLGEHGAILRGAMRADVPGVPVHPVSTVGAGDVLTGTLLAKLALSGFYAPAVAAALPSAVAAAAVACERWGALD